ncbi:MAG: hypothetical protein ACK5P7_06105 [Bdellovibrio sp.]|jgi:hypothetical protein
MKSYVLMVFAVLVSSVQVFAQAEGGRFPIGPDRTLTPGSYCTTPDSYRYKEHIPYCKRDVETSEKMQIIQDYNDKLGFRIEKKQRPQFKIDHLIPLCAGGSNQADNLWPQHESIYKITDPIEGLACQRMGEGKLTQKKAIEMIFAAKHNLKKAPEILDLLQSM